MKPKRLGKQPPRYTFLMNPYPHERLTRCIQCKKPTFLRKFPLFIHVKKWGDQGDSWGTLILGKTGPYCAKCEIIVCHQHELEAELANSPARFVPTPDDKWPYMVIGTVDRKVWKKSVATGQPPPGDPLDHLADFKKHLELHVEGGGWRREP